MGLVTAPATSEAHRRVLKGEWAALVPMTLETTWLIGGEQLHHRRPDAAMRVVAIDTAHRALLHLVMKRLLELRTRIQMAALTLLVDRRPFARH
jgi:hypothetical protein